jgi:hypothetical protein
LRDAAHADTVLFLDTAHDSRAAEIETTRQWDIAIGPSQLAIVEQGALIHDSCTHVCSFEYECSEAKHIQGDPSGVYPLLMIDVSLQFDT